MIIRRLLAAVGLVGVILFGTTGPASGAPEAREQAGSYIEAGSTFFTYLTRSSDSDCGGNPACDIEFTSVSVRKSSPQDLDVVIAMTGATSSTIPDSSSGGMLVYVDSDASREGNEFGIWTRAMSYPLKEAVPSFVYAWDGGSWKETTTVGYWLRSDRAWGAFIPWQELGIRSARIVVRSDGSKGEYDFSPASGLTPVIPIAALVAGAPGQPMKPVATAGQGQVTLAWQPPASTGSSPVTSYTVTASPGGKTCSSASTSCTVTGLSPGTTYFFEVTATSAQGTGPASDPVPSTPTGKIAVPGKVVDLKAYSQPGEGQLTISWKPPTDVGGGSLKGYQVRVGKKPWASTSITLMVVSRLRAGQVLTIQVRAVNQGGPGPVSTIQGTVR